ncbi:MAG: hypothetical protein Q4F49_00340 [Pseudoxanthomonas suwonensis]|nr:hypothetical protein [Pseudoxanthomonas suwonensis]
MTTRHIRITFATLAIALLAACSRPSPPDTGGADNGPGAQTVLGRAVERALSKAREELSTRNISLNDTVRIDNGNIDIGPDSGNDTRPKAEITPQGELLIDGKAVAATPAQRELLLAYRGNLIAVVEAGITVGVRGADLGMRAAGEAVRGIFSGNADDIERRIEAEAESLKHDAQGVCRTLEPMLDTQQQLAASMPEFAPYATLSRADIDKCLADAEEDGSTSARASSAAGVTTSSASASGGGSASLDGIEFLVPPGPVAVASSNGAGNLDVADIEVRLQDQRMRINGVDYPRPAAGSVVDLREAGKVIVDGVAATPL